MRKATSKIPGIIGSHVPLIEPLTLAKSKTTNSENSITAITIATAWWVGK